MGDINMGKETFEGKKTHHRLTDYTMRRSAGLIICTL